MCDNCISNIFPVPNSLEISFPFSFVLFSFCLSHPFFYVYWFMVFPSSHTPFLQIILLFKIGNRHVAE